VFGTLPRGSDFEALTSRVLQGTSAD
jgi:hypothetical protein